MKYQEYCGLLAAWLRDLAALIESGDVSASDVAQALFNDKPGLYPVTCPLSEQQSRAGDAMVDRSDALWPGPVLEPPFCASDARWQPAQFLDVRYQDVARALRDAQAEADRCGQPARMQIKVTADGIVWHRRVWIYPLATFDKWMIERDADGAERPVFIGASEVR